MKDFGILPLGTLLAALVAHDAAADTTLTAFSANLPVDFAPFTMAQPDANGLWVAGIVLDPSPTYVHEKVVLARYRNDGSIALLRDVASPHIEAFPLRLIAMPDGGVLLGGNDADTCQLNRYDASGNLRWQRLAPEPPPPGPICSPITVDGAGGVWVSADPVYRLSDDGAVESQVALNGFIVNDIVGDPSGPNAYLVGTDSNSYGVGRAVVERLSEHGDVLWKASPAPAASGAFELGLGAPDGGIYAFGKTYSSSTNLKAFYGVKLGSDGHVLWQHTNDAQSDVYTEDAALGPDGNAVVAYRENLRRTLAKTGANGAFAWSLRTGTIDDCIGYTRVRAAANGDTLLECDHDTASPYNGYLLRVSAQGSLIFSHSSPYVGFGDVRALADSSALSIQDHFVLTDNQGKPIGGSNDVEFAHLDATGAALPTAPQAKGAVAFGGNVAAGTFGPDGSAYVATDAFDGTHFELARVAPEGQVLWRQTLNGIERHAEYPTRLALTSNAVCLVSVQGVACYANADGARLGYSVFGGPGVLEKPIARTLDDGSLLILHYDASGPRQLLLDPNGATLANRPLPQGTFKSIDGSGASFVVLAGDGTGFAKITRNGTHQYDAQLPPASGAITQGYLAADGSALLLSVTNSRANLTRVDAHGATLWTHPIAATPPHPFAVYDDVRAFDVRGGYVYFMLGERFADDGFDPPAHFPYVVEKVALSDGSLAWSTPIDGDGGVAPAVLVDAGGQRVLIATASTPNRLRTRVLNAVDGTTQDDRMDGCAADSCALIAAAIGGDGALRAMLDAEDASAGQFERLLRRTPPFDAPAPIRVDQPGIAGAWYAPYASGQGFSIDYFASANTVFMPWFTYTVDGGNSPSGLAWYALQGVADPGAQSVDLAITAPDPGVFATGTAGVHTVGSAQLRFSDCSNATLTYRFGGGFNGNATGVVALSRLTSPSQPCVLADSSSSPVQAPAAAQGFEARQSGSWYDPATSGQGLEISVVPPSGGSNGLLFAAWFTFDPAGAADEPTHQHWFTLQGDLAVATNGSVSLPILRTIGGSFDAQATANTVQVGSATLTFSACDTAQLDYRFDQSAVAHAFAGLSGTVHLTRIGGCGAP